MIGFLAGTIGIVLTYLLSIPINLIVNHLLPTQNIGQIALLAPWTGGILLVFNVLLTLVSGLIPSRIAANKDPVEAPYGVEKRYSWKKRKENREQRQPLSTKAKLSLMKSFAIHIIKFSEANLVNKGQSYHFS